MHSKKLMIIDGSAMLVRAYFASAYGGRILRSSQGVYTNAVLGFLNMMLNAIDQIEPTHLFVAWDVSRDTFRRKLFPAYKGTRGELPDELTCQFDTMQDVLDALEVKQHADAKYEADDIIGTLSHQAANAGMNVFIVTGDRDALQLVRDEVTVCIMKKGTREMMYYTPQEIEAQYGLTVQQFVDLKALMGDTSDNIPGIPGVGEKTAIKLLQQFGTVEELLTNTGALTGKLKDKVETHQDLARLSKLLATIALDVPLPFAPDACKLAFNHIRAYEKLTTLDLHRVQDQLAKHISAV